MMVVGDTEGRGYVVIVMTLLLTGYRAVHSSPGFQSYGWGWILDSTGWIPDSRDCIPDFKALDSSFQRQKTLDSGFRIPLHGANLSGALFWVRHSTMIVSSSQHWSRIGVHDEPSYSVLFSCFCLRGSWTAWKAKSCSALTTNHYYTKNSNFCEGLGCGTHGVSYWRRAKPKRLGFLTFFGPFYFF